MPTSSQPRDIAPDAKSPGGLGHPTAVRLWRGMHGPDGGDGVGLRAEVRRRAVLAEGWHEKEGTASYGVDPRLPRPLVEINPCTCFGSMYPWAVSQKIAESW